MLDMTQNKGYLAKLALQPISNWFEITMIAIYQNPMEVVLLSTFQTFSDAFFFIKNWFFDTNTLKFILNGLIEEKSALHWVIAQLANRQQAIKCTNVNQVPH